MISGALPHTVEAVSPVHRGCSRVVDTVLHELIAELIDTLEGVDEGADVNRLEEMVFVAGAKVEGRHLALDQLAAEKTRYGGGLTDDAACPAEVGLERNDNAMRPLERNRGHFEDISKVMSRPQTWHGDTNGDQVLLHDARQTREATKVGVHQGVHVVRTMKILQDVAPRRLALTTDDVELIEGNLPAGHMRQEVFQTPGTVPVVLGFALAHR